jgi:ABC-type antimicrobial peptide transport system permease subunit
MVRGKVDLRELPPETTNFLQGDLTGIFDSSTTAKTADLGVRVSDVERALSDTGTTRAGASADTGSWNFLLIKLKPGVDRRVFQRNLEDRFRLLGLEARVGDWKAAAGSGAALAGSLSVAFNIGLVLLGVVIVLILANIFYTWVIERTAEIATMRALGASKGLVVSLFFTESTILSIVSAAFGVLVCSALVFWMGRRGFTTDNRILMLVFGGTKLRPLLTSRSVVGGFLGAIAVGATAILLPLRLALKVALVKAMDAE